MINLPDNLKQKIPEVITCMGLGTFFSLCLVGYGSILYIWQTTDPGCVCYSQRIYMSRGRFENMRQLYDTAIYVLAPILSFLFFKISSSLSVHTKKSLLITSGVSLAGFFILRSIFHEDIPANYYLFVMVGKIMAYHHGAIGNNLIQPMFTWAFLCGLTLFFVSSSVLALKNKLQKNNQAMMKEATS